MREPSTQFNDYVEYLQSLEAASQDHFLIGGQAVNFWAEYFERRGHDDELSSLRPFTSKDCDVWLGGRLWTQIKEAERTRLIVGSSPADGQLGILTLRASPPLLVDMMSAIFGFKPSENQYLRDRALVFNGVRIMDPISLFRCKCHCLVHLDQAGRQDARHVRVLSLVLPQYLSGLIALVTPSVHPCLHQSPESTLQSELDQPIHERNVLKEIKHLRKILSTSVCRRALAGLSISPESLIPWETIRCSGSSRLAKFAAAEDKRTE